MKLNWKDRESKGALQGRIADLEADYARMKDTAKLCQENGASWSRECERLRAHNARLIAAGKNGWRWARLYSTSESCMRPEEVRQRRDEYKAWRKAVENVENES